MGILNVYIFAIVAMFPLLIIAILIKKNDLTLNNKKHKLLYHVCFLIITQLLLEILTYYFSLLDMRKWYFITYIAHDAYFLLDVLIFYKLALISVFDDKNSKVLHIIATIPFAIYVVLLFINHFTPIMFSIDKSYTGVTDTLDIAYVRGSLIWISFLIAGIYGVYFFISQMIRVRKFSRFNAFVLLMIGLLMLIGMAGQILFSIPLMWPSISTCIVLYYLHSCGMKFDTDLFTNVDNRNTFERRMIEFEKYKEVWVIVCDVNELKYINDTFGHRKGDELLSVTASLLAKLFSNYGAVSRIGGDEFCILCPTKQSKNQINTLMTKVNMGIKNKIKEVRVNYPLSYGFARYRKSDNDKRLIDVFEDADLMMFEMKKKIK